MLQNAYLLAKIGADTAENERNFANNWQLPYGSTTFGRVLERRGRDAYSGPGDEFKMGKCPGFAYTS